MALVIDPRMQRLDNVFIQNADVEFNWRAMNQCRFHRYNDYRPRRGYTETPTQCKMVQQVAAEVTARVLGVGSVYEFKNPVYRCEHAPPNQRTHQRVFGHNLGSSSKQTRASKRADFERISVMTLRGADGKKIDALSLSPHFGISLELISQLHTQSVKTAKVANAGTFPSRFYRLFLFFVYYLYTMSM